MFLVAMGLITLAPQGLRAAALVLHPDAAQPFFSEEGLASRYSGALRGKKTADGEHFNQHALTGAHRSLPFNTVVRVTDLASGKTAKVRINDRGPFRKTRIIDLSTAAAALLGMVKNRIERVRLEVFADDQTEGETKSGPVKREHASKRVMDGPH